MVLGFFFVFLFLVHVYVYVVRVHTLAMVHVGVRFSSHRMSPREKTHVIRLGGKHTYLLSCLPSPRTFVESHRVS